MTHLQVTHTAPPHPSPAAGGAAATLAHNATHLTGMDLLLIIGVAVLLLGAVADRMQAKPATAKNADRAVWRTIKGLFTGTWSLACFLARLLGGRPLRATLEPTSDATWWTWGTDTTTKTQQPKPLRVTLGLDAPTKQPSAWAVRARSQAATWADKADPKRRAPLIARLTLLAAALLTWPLFGWPWALLLAVLDAATIARVRRAAHAVWTALAAIYGALRSWGRWPYAYRAAVRLVLLAGAVGLANPAWRGWTEAGTTALSASVFGVALVRRPRPADLTDADRYAPALWELLRDDLGLPEGEDRIAWLEVPNDLSDEAARVRVLLPWTFRGTDNERAVLDQLVNSRLPGQWESRWDFTSQHHTATWKHHVPKQTAPAAEPPAFVDLFSQQVQDIFDTLDPETFYLGQDENDQPILQKMAGEQSHWALSVGSGGGKSAFMQFLAAQMIRKRGTIIPIDPKMISLTPLLKVHGVHPYVDPSSPGDMRSALLWVAEVVKARNYEKKHGIRTEFEPLYIVLEENNELADLLKEDYTANKTSSDPAGDPIWRDGVAKTLRLGREVNVHIIAVFQDFKDNQFGGVSLMPLFPLKIMGSYNERQWKRLFGTGIPMIPTVKKAGRMVLLLDDGTVTRIQTPYVPFDPEKSKDENQRAAYARLAAYYDELRETYGYSPEGLYTAPPAPSPEEMPTLLRALSRDEGANAESGPQDAPGGAWEDETAGDGVTLDLGVTGPVTGPRDRFRLIPGQAGAQAADPLAPPRLLTLAEAARELEALGFEIKEGTIRQHKVRRESIGFPQGIMVDGTEKWTLDQFVTFYESRDEKRNKRA